eukprot:1071545-Alexandrium_andersonii.AAC.1
MAPCREQPPPDHDAIAYRHGPPAAFSVPAWHATLTLPRGLSPPHRPPSRARAADPGPHASR